MGCPEGSFLGIFQVLWYTDTHIHEARSVLFLDKSFISEKTISVWICKKNIALKISYKIVALFTENYPSKEGKGDYKRETEGERERKKGEERYAQIKKEAVQRANYWI